jgi:succinyl-CoA synthetase alpha subunit
MSILIDQRKRVIVQGITGREGTSRTPLMRGYGTNVVAGVTPGRGGTEAAGVPVYDTVRASVEAHGPVDVSVVFVPAPLVKDAACEALDAGVGLVLLVPDRVPVWDVLEIARKAEATGGRFIGPNTLGVLSPGKASIGMIGGSAREAKAWFRPGRVGVTSRSGGLTSAIAYYLSRAGIGLSTIVHVGGDAVLGLSHPEVLLLFEDDPETDAVVLYGEIGTTQEERVADLPEAGRFTKPLVACLGGRAAAEGTRFSHAGAIIEGGRGTYEGKVTRLRQAGAHVVDAVDALPEATRRVLESLQRNETTRP